MDNHAVLAALQPLWQTIPETASRVRGRIEAVLDYAKAHGLRSGENPATWRGHLALILPKHGKFGRSLSRTMRYEDIPSFMAALRKHESIASSALEFAILAAARSGEVLGAQWDEIDLDARIWTIPAARMKSGVLHRVPLSEALASILSRMASIRTSEFIFDSTRSRRQGLSVTAMARALAAVGGTGVTVHGFRSSFS